MLRTLFVSTLAATLVTSCSMTPPKRMMDVQAGEKFVLKKPLMISKGHGRAFIQLGKEIKESKLDHYDQHCSIEVKHLQNKPLTIQPEIFTISKVRIDVVEVVENTHSNILFANNDYGIQSDANTSPLQGIAFAGSDRGAPAPTYDVVHFMLQSPSKQNVYRLTCAGSLSNGDPLDAPRSYRPQRKQANKILGSIGEIHP